MRVRARMRVRVRMRGKARVRFRARVKGKVTFRHKVWGTAGFFPRVTLWPKIWFCMGSFAYERVARVGLVY